MAPNTEGWGEPTLTSQGVLSVPTSSDLALSSHGSKPGRPPEPLSAGLTLQNPHCASSAQNTPLQRVQRSGPERTCCFYWSGKITALV